MMMGIARDRWMLYSEGGAAWAHHDYGLAVNAVGITFVSPFTNIPIGFAPPGTSDTLVGWTIGTGVKWAMSNNWFLNVEYDYMDFGSKGRNFSAVCATPVNITPFGTSGPCGGGIVTTAGTFNPTFNSQISEVKVGLNYKFAAGFLLW
jgi:opacity protein-like surface antigen